MKRHKFAAMLMRDLHRCQAKHGSSCHYTVYTFDSWYTISDERIVTFFDTLRKFSVCV